MIYITTLVYITAWVVDAWSWLYPVQPKEKWFIALVWLAWPLLTVLSFGYLIFCGWKKA